MSWNKAYQNWIIWKNRPSTQSPIDEIALNKISYGLDTVDDRVLSLDSTKADKVTLDELIKNIVLNTDTGVFTITWYDNHTTTIDTLLEKIAVNFDYDDDPESAHYQNLIITLDDGTVKYIDLSALITEFEFDDSSTILYNVSGGRVSSEIKLQSVKEEHIDPAYFAKIALETAKAEAAASAAEESASDAHLDALMAESHNHGNSGIRPDEETDNAKYYKEMAASYRDEAQQLLDAMEDVEDEIDRKIEMAHFTVDFTTGNLVYTNEAVYNFTIDTSDGMLKWEVLI